MLNTDMAREALFAIPPDLPRDEWVKATMGAHAAGLDFDTFNDWSAQGSNYDPAAARDTWRSIKPGKGVGAGTLYHMARAYGWGKSGRTDAQPLRPAPAKRTAKPATRESVNAAELWDRCEPATAAHPYIVAKAADGVPLAGLRVVPDADPLNQQGERLAGSLVVPVLGADGIPSSLQFITPPETAERLKAKGKPGKLNLAGASLNGWFTVGELLPGGVAYLCEGIGQAWACWKATGCAAVVCFGWGRVRTVAEALRQRDPSARLVLVPDVGKEGEAQDIARDAGAMVAAMPEGWPRNADVNDYAQREGFDALDALLSAATEPPKPEARFKLLTSGDLAELPPLRWMVRSVLPAEGLAGLYGPSASGKSFLALDLCAAIAAGRPWFGNRTQAAPVVYCALEGEGGIRLRAQAWEAHRGYKLPKSMRFVLQPFKLTDPQDVRDLAAVVLDAGGRGGLVVLDTLNRAAPTADENSSQDMGLIIEAAKRLQALTDGLVLLVHHTGKDATKGLRGHSSLFAALDAAVEVSRDGERRAWTVAKSKDGQDGDAHPFRLQVEVLALDEHDDPVTSCVVVRDESAKDVQRVRIPRGGNQKLVLEALRPMFKDGVTGKPGAPAMRPCIELEAAIVAASKHLTCESHRRVTRAREAITGLIAGGVMGLNEDWLWLT